MSKTVGSRELKTRLGTYLRLVDEGTTFVVTHRGRPIAELRPVDSSQTDWDDIVDEMIKLGEASWPTRSALPHLEPIAIEGAPASDTIVADREDRF